MTVKELYEILQSFYSNGWGNWKILTYDNYDDIVPLTEELIEVDTRSEEIIFS